MEMKPERAGCRYQSVVLQDALCLAEVVRRMRAGEGTRIHTLSPPRLSTVQAGAFSGSSPPSRLSNEVVFLDGGDDVSSFYPTGFWDGSGGNNEVQGWEHQGPSPVTHC